MHPKLGQVSKAREDRDDPMDVGGFGQWKGRDFLEGKRKDFHWHWQRKGNRKRWKRWCEIIGTSEHTENSKSVLELRENRSPIQGLLGEPWQMATATELRDIQILLEREAMRRAGQAKVVEREGKSKEAGALVWYQQPSPVASSVASSTPHTETSTTVGTVDAI